MKNFIIYLLLTILLWPLAIVILILKLRQSFTRYPKRLGLMGSATIECAIVFGL